VVGVGEGTGFLSALFAGHKKTPSLRGGRRSGVGLRMELVWGESGGGEDLEVRIHSY